MAKKLTTEQFIEKAKEIHKNKYNYDKVNYINSCTKITITCPIHGDFEQTPNSHLNGNGCPKCYEERRGSASTMSTEQFIAKAKEVHNDKYNYDKTNYIDSHTPVTITCPIHGDFEQTPNNHLRGRGCNACGYEHASIIQRDSPQEFVNKANIVHNNKYRYNNIDQEYINNRSKITITCPIHGDFVQEASSHLCGKGCPCCCESKLEKEVRIYMEINKINFIRYKTWDWLIYRSKQFVDFYLPEFNSIIECQGAQHFIANDFFDKEDSFDIRVNRDNNKRNLCINHGLKIYYYSNIIKENQIKDFKYPYQVFEDIDIMFKEILAQKVM